MINFNKNGATTGRFKYKRPNKSYEPKEISLNTLKMIDSSIKNFKKGVVGPPINKELKKLKSK